MKEFVQLMLRDITVSEDLLLQDADRFGAMQVIVHAGSVFLKKAKRSSGYLRALRAIVVAAKRDTRLSVEFLLNTGDFPQQHNKTGTPLFSMCRGAHTFDIPAPNPCGAVDQVCAWKTLPWSQRRDAVFARFSYFCGSTGMRGCQRTFFSRLANDTRATFATNLSWDIAPVNGAYGTDVTPRPFVPIEEWASNKYLLSTDGWTSACRFGQSLAMGSVTLKVSSNCKMWFEHFIRANTDFVSVWDEGDYDIIPKLVELQHDGTRAAKIADSGKRAACQLLSMEGHVTYWAKMLTQYQAQMTYEINAEVIQRRGAVKVSPQNISCLETNWLCSWRTS